MTVHSCHIPGFSRRTRTTAIRWMHFRAASRFFHAKLQLFHAQFPTFHAEASNFHAKAAVSRRSARLSRQNSIFHAAADPHLNTTARQRSLSSRVWKFSRSSPTFHFFRKAFPATFSTIPGNSWYNTLPAFIQRGRLISRRGLTMAPVIFSATSAAGSMNFSTFLT